MRSQLLHVASMNVVIDDNELEMSYSEAKIIGAVVIWRYFEAK